MSPTTIFSTALLSSNQLQFEQGTCFIKCEGRLDQVLG